ncbi:MAG: PKD domain-containing protein [Methanoregulaceae archaeon]|nr:PKD domain-containing protein [Methanoregulaceae archaeon]
MGLECRKAGAFIGVLLCLIMLCGIISANGVLDPKPPHIFYGNVSIVGVPAPADTTISAMVDGGSGILITDTPGKYGGPGALSPKLLVQGEIPNASEIEFFVNGMPARCREYGTLVWEGSYPYTSGGITNLDLNVEEIPLSADFSGNPTAGYVPLAVQFTDLSTGFHDEWSWDFGDGGSSSSANPSHIYHDTGTYTVMLEVRDSSDGTSSTKTRSGYITVAAIPPVPVAAFTANVTTGPAPLAVKFTDLSTGSPHEWGWSFGDTSTSGVQNPVHTYTRPGYYTVTLAIRGLSGTDSETKVNYIHVTGFPPAANFTANRTSGSAPLAVAFTDLSTGFPESWTWSFGDGTSSSEQNPVHRYTTAGFFTVNLTVTNTEGSDTLSRSDYIQVTSSLSPTASFIGNPVAGYEPLLVRFSDSSTGAITAWQWSFGDGAASNEQNPNHTYNTGHYTVSLTVSNETGSDTLTKSDYITVYPRGSAGGGGGGGGGGSPSGTFYIGGENATKTVTPTPTPTVPPSGSLILGPDNTTTQQVTIVSSDGIASLVIGVGVAPVDPSGRPMRTVSVITLAPGSVPAGSPCASIPFAYEISPSGSTFTPAVLLMFSPDRPLWSASSGESVSIIWYNASTRSWEEIPARADSGSGAVEAMVSRGGIYALCIRAAPPAPVTTVPTVSPAIPGESGIPWSIVIPVIVLLLVAVGVIAYFISTRTFKGGPPPEGGI